MSWIFDSINYKLRLRIHWIERQTQCRTSNQGQNHLLSSPVLIIMGSLAGPGPIFVEADTVML